MVNYERSGSYFSRINGFQLSEKPTRWQRDHEKVLFTFFEGLCDDFREIYHEIDEEILEFDLFPGNDQKVLFSQISLEPKYSFNFSVGIVVKFNQNLIPIYHERKFLQNFFWPKIRDWNNQKKLELERINQVSEHNLGPDENMYYIFQSAWVRGGNIYL